jgi:GNAT superfamily N-acetyltransferase
MNGRVLQGIELGKMRREEIGPAAELAARGMRDNLSSIALFGGDPTRRLRDLKPLYHWVLDSLAEPSLVVRRRGHLVGLAALSPPDRCFFLQMTARQRHVRVGRISLGVTVPRVPRGLVLPLLGLGPGHLGRLSAWGEASAEHDPEGRHQHVELVVVEAALQGLGIGRLMMEELCREIDRLPDISYLETDKRENVRFYEQFDFEVTAEATVLGTQCWYMSRRSHR